MPWRLKAAHTDWGKPQSVTAVDWTTGGACITFPDNMSTLPSVSATEIARSLLLITSPLRETYTDPALRQIPSRRCCS